MQPFIPPVCTSVAYQRSPQPTPPSFPLTTGFWLLTIPLLSAAISVFIKQKRDRHRWQQIIMLERLFQDAG
ncbi:hypothetical protein [Thermoleptolyngbya sp. C42_A2020_037]|uniref:hypothetical protein n=1 Tax=Thermoleptolyngbya sp. C42_A2020_037 TaxID=2747799 RepID=UPI001A0A4137|nr:hypothetical protein [Thermoleptolyngbya sp. C42_A2020_037]MBF2085457.1 hypothetical protein [Thermoleptolyngbya sp. C42_A2020_037]